jgi:hypothetical protein
MADEKEKEKEQPGKLADGADGAGGVEGGPFADLTRRVDIVLYPPVPGTILAYKKVTIHATDERGIEFADGKGNYYRVANMPMIVVSFDPSFDPDTEGRLVRGSA